MPTVANEEQNNPIVLSFGRGRSGVLPTDSVGAGGPVGAFRFLPPLVGMFLERRAA